MSGDRSCPVSAQPDAAMHAAVAATRAHLPNRDVTASMSTLYSLPTGLRPAGTFEGTIIMDLGPNLDVFGAFPPSSAAVPKPRFPVPMGCSMGDTRTTSSGGQPPCADFLPFPPGVSCFSVSSG